MRILIVSILLPFYSLSQQSINAEKFFEYGLANVQNAEQTTLEEVKFPWINKYEFRTETRDFDFNRQEYTLRLSPSTGKIRNAQKALYQELSSAPDFDAQEMNCNQLLSIHKDWLTLYMINEHKVLLEEVVSILNDKQKIYEKMVAAYELNPEKILKLKTEKSDVVIDRNQLNLEQDYLLQKYSLFDSNIDFGDFITIDAISATLPNWRDEKNEAQFLDPKTTYRRLLLTKEMELEAAEEKQLFDFVQVKYTGPHADQLQERLSVGLGLQILNSGSKKLKMQELKIKEEELKLNSERRINEKRLELDLILKELQRDIQAYASFKEIVTEEREELKTLSGNISKSAGTSPLLILEIEERHLSMKRKELQMKENLLEAYLEYLQKSEKMCQASDFNYLTN